MKHSKSFQLLNEYVHLSVAKITDRKKFLLIVVYGAKNMTVTIHQLLHMSSFVLRYGPLWTTWAFSFENFNGFITSFVHGTQCVERQLQDAYQMNQALLEIEAGFPDQGTYIYSI